MKNSQRSAVVLGASIAGVLAARALSSHFDDILVLERAELPDRPVHRSTVPQGRHTHGLLAGGVDAIERLLPGLVGELEAKGCPSGDNLRDVSWIFGGARLAVGDSGVRGIAVARPVLEHAIRARVLGLAGVRLQRRTRVTGLVVKDGRIAGVRTKAADGADETVSANVVVDAMGRGSTLPEFLEEMGYPAPRIEEVELATNYVSRTYGRTAAHAACGIGVVLISSPEVPRGGIALAIDERTWIVSQYGLGSVRPPLDTSGYLEFARSLSGPHLARLLETSEPLDDPATMKFASSRRLHYEELRRLPDGLFICGDALACFNPTFGQGITVAALQAERLASMGRRVEEPGANRRFLQQASEVVDVAWNTVAGRSFTYEGVRGQSTRAMRISNAYMPRIVECAISDVTVATALVRAMHFLAPPRSLFAPAILAKLLFRRPKRQARPGIHLEAPASSSAERQRLIPR